MHTTQAIRHIRHLLTKELAQTLACSLILSRIDYCKLCSTALQATASRSCSEYRTIQLGAFSKLLDDPTLGFAEDATLAVLSAQDRVQSGSADIQSPQYLDAVVPATP